MLRMILDALEELSQTQSEQQRTDVTDVGTNVGINVGTNEEKLLTSAQTGWNADSKGTCRNAGNYTTAHTSMDFIIR